MAGNKGIVSSQFYTFSAANKTITFSNDYAGLDLGEITYITNIKNGVATVIYDPFDATKGGILNGLTLTLAYDTSLMSNTDPLQIITGFTPLNADPLPVTIVEGPDQKDDTDLLNRIVDNLDFLNLALDQSEGIEINTRDKSIKKDSAGAIVSSDGIEYQPKLLKVTNEAYTIDTTGYNNVIFSVIASPTININAVVEISNDGINWYGQNFVVNSPGGTAALIPIGSATAFITGNTTYIISAGAPTKFIRFRISLYTSGAITVTAILKNTQPYTVSGGSPFNLTAINSVTPATAQNSNTALANGGTGGTLAIGGIQAPTTNPPNAVTALQTTVPYPIGVGGREIPYIGALSGIFRYFSLDARGNILMGGDTAFRTPNMGGVVEQSNAGTTRGIGGVFNNIQGAQSLTTVDTGQVEGDTNTMLLRQILQELKILNQQFIELPNILNQANYPISDPQEYRNDNSTTQF